MVYAAFDPKLVGEPPQKPSEPKKPNGLVLDTPARGKATSTGAAKPSAPSKSIPARRRRTHKQSMNDRRDNDNLLGWPLTIRSPIRRPARSPPKPRNRARRSPQNRPPRRPQRRQRTKRSPPRQRSPPRHQNPPPKADPKANMKRPCRNTKRTSSGTRTTNPSTKRSSKGPRQGQRAE